jgi:hypothetical protein
MKKFGLVLALCLVSAVALAESGGGLRWKTPDGWKTGNTEAARVAVYIVAPAGSDKSAAECGVYFFGAGQGGTVEANIDRWRGQVQGPGGDTAPAAIGRRRVNGLAITTIDSSGVYWAMGGPSVSTVPPSPGYRLLGAVVAGPRGNLFVKFVGPASTIAANQKQFEQLLASFEKE